jgi:hypothetical protein
MKSDGAVLVRDLGSTNGCRINGQKTKAGAMLPNDVLSIAVFDFRLYVGDETPGAAGPASDKTELVDLSELAALDGGPDPSRAAKIVPDKSSHEERRGGGYTLRE